MVLKDQNFPDFTQLIFDWIKGLPVDVAIEKMELMGVCIEAREAFLRYQSERSDKIDITPEMAIAGAPGQDRPMPQVGSRNVQQTF
jgi:hypothetical protein